MIKKVMLLLLLCCSAPIVFAQSNETSMPVINVLPKSPDAASLGKFGDIPVGLSTGVPEISVPFWEIKLKGLSFPVSLNYHSSGIKVDEVASTVGLGWALQSGGMVSVSVNGLADVVPTPVGNKPVFSVFGYPNATRKTPQTGNIKTTWAMNDRYFEDPEYLYAKEALDGRNDTEPDLFSVNYGGKSLKFYFDQDKQIHTIPFKRVKITMTTDGFTLVDEQDNVFEFNTPEVTTTTSNTYSIEYISQAQTDKNVSYLLTKVTTPMGEVLRYSYVLGGYNMTNQVVDTRYANNNLSGCATVLPQLRRVLSSTRVNPQMISSIVSSSGDSVAFTYANGRLDFSGASKLVNVEVYSTAQKLRSFALAYDHFSSPNPGSNPDSAYKRLKLVSVIQQGQPAYVFDYNSLNLPKRLSYAQDHWGYFNGSGNDAPGINTLLPLDVAHGFTSGADREINLSASQAAMLTAIHYPTGGKSVFEYEGNDKYITEEVAVANPSRLNSTAETSTVKTVNFTIPADAFDLQVFYTTTSQPMEDLETLGGTSQVIKILQGTTLIRQLSGSNAEGEAVNWPAGNYTAKICSDPNGIGVMLNIHWRITGESQTQTISGNRYVGGLRIKSTSDYASTAAVPVVSRYEYKKFSDPEASSGMGGVFAVYTYPHHVDTHIPSPEAVSTCTFIAQNSGSMLPLTSIQGGNVFYDEVRVYKQDKTLNGYTDTRFFPGGRVDGSFHYPFTPVIAYDWMDGMVLEQTSYQYNTLTANFSPVKKTVNTYKTGFGQSQTGPHESYIRGIKLAQLHPLVFSFYSVPQPIQMPEYLYESYYLITSWTYPLTTTEITYDALDASKFTTVEKVYHFDNPAHLEMTAQETSRSDGSQYKMQYRYPLDVNPAYTFNSSPPVEKRLLLNDGSQESLVSADLTLYQAGTGSFPTAYYSYTPVEPVLPSVLANYSGSGVSALLEKRLDYQYDAQRNLVSTLKDARPTGYHWNAKGDQVLAVCSPASAQDFYFEGYEESTGSNIVTGPGHTGKKYNTSSAVSWTPADASMSYSASYWYRAAGKWSYSGVLAYTGSGLTMSGGDAYDDVRIYPALAQLTTYTYEPLVGLSTSTDAKNQTTYYEYDANQRLKALKDQNGFIIKTYCYTYAGQPTECNFVVNQTYHNVAQSGSFTRNNCSAGGTGASLTYTIAANQYSSTLSQADADSQAMAAVNAGGQAYANANAGCTYSNVAQSSSFTRNNCGAGGTGGTVTYTIAANQYSSALSQADANSQALAAVNAGGQAYANANAVCTYSNAAQSGSFTRNNCSAGGNGGTIAYTISANLYSSTTSQADADSQAMAAVNAGGQAYANANASCTYYNAAQSGSFTRNNCGAGGNGGTITYTIAASQYSSTTSQADANSQALAAVNAGGQAYANANANCTYYNLAQSGNFTRNNCSAGGNGGAVTYTIGANQYSSNASQADANNQAMAAVNAGGQAYANANASCTYYNAAQSGSFTRNNCGTGGNGGTVTYTIGANQYSSTSSQADADGQAMAAVNAGGQAYANANAGCTYYNLAQSAFFTKNNCSSGGSGGGVTYTIAANQYSSTSSQADANNQAMAAVNAGGQAYANANAGCTYFNLAQNVAFYKNDCSGGPGPAVSYTVSAGNYTSTVSQAAADQLATNDVNSNGQAFANANGTCAPDFVINVLQSTYSVGEKVSVTFSSGGLPSGTKYQIIVTYPDNTSSVFAAKTQNLFQFFTNQSGGYEVMGRTISPSNVESLWSSVYFSVN